MEKVKHIPTKELLQMHGPTGGLIARLQRYSLLGWGLAGVLLLVLVAYVFVDKLMPVPVLAVDEQGRILGQFEYLSPDSRTDNEVVAGSVAFLRHYLSANSAFVMDDYTEALNMMEESLREQKLAGVLENNYLTRIANANTVSHLDIDKEHPPEILWRREQLSMLRVRGNVVAQAGNNVVERPFDISLEMRSVPRTTLATTGFRITKVMDN
ncbi:MAG: hypothetical protein FD165_2620 [Gammaproteobacteria bacterium]|nr:MAG: hypothetical protein FD165_2620 [Gammaproteobacteria bacterium]TND01593.1 MAG: hypothetical protein FD120_2541 [Gammaproteobacteria bacterium]